VRFLQSEALGAGYSGYPVYYCKALGLDWALNLYALWTKMLYDLSAVFFFCRPALSHPRERKKLILMILISGRNGPKRLT